MYGRLATPAQRRVDVPAQTQTRAVANAADAFLATLSAYQRQKALFTFMPQDKGNAVGFSMLPAGGPKGPRRGPGGPGGPGDHGPSDGPGGRKPPAAGEKYGAAVWSSFPVDFVVRPSIRLGELTAPQRAAAMHLMRVTLSPKGFQKNQDIMASDQALADAGTDFVTGRDVYSIAIFGTPSAIKPWMIEFGGHHLGLKLVLAGAHGAMTPTLTGAHTVTLALAVEGWVHLPSQLVEVVIAVSIVFVAVQNMFWPQRSHGPSRLAVALLFGLFHGLGFAGGLLDLMYQCHARHSCSPLSDTALAGNQSVLLPLYALLATVRSGKRPWAASPMQRTGSALVAAGALYFSIMALSAA
ncbi:MAG: DUF3500 domain-containing protein [Janthinobacterium lividum]